MTSGAYDPGPVRRGPGAGGTYSVDVQGGLGVQVGEGNTQIIYAYSQGTWTDGVAPPPLASVSGLVESPYRGLAAFGEEDAPFFFGREEATARVLERMSRLAEGGGLLVVSGASGAGKSSLLRAGVLPRLRGAGLASDPGAASWPCLVLTPGRAPADELAVRVALLAGANAWVVRQGLAADPAGFGLIARQAALTRGGERLLLVVDQFEQVFTQCADEGERRAFVAALCAATSGAPSGHRPAALVVLGVRADFEARCAAYPELAGAVQDRYLVTAMTERQLRLAINGPARAAGSRVEDELAGALLAEVQARQGAEAGVLPLLSHALDQAWRSRAGHSLTLADYERTGGIEGAVAASAGRAYDQLTAGQRAAARQVFTRLVATSVAGVDTADRATRAELTEGKSPAQAADVDGVLEAFAAERLLTLAADSVEISHEALLTAWPLLHDTWLAETHADRIVRTRLRGTAAEWERRSRDSSYLYRGTLLRAADEAAGRATADPGRNPPLSRVERSFLRASGRARRRATSMWRAVSAVLAILVLVASWFAYSASQQRAVAREQQGVAIENQILAEAGQLSASNPSLADQLLLTAYRREPSPDLAQRLISTENRALSVSRSLRTTAFSVAFAPYGHILAIGTSNAVTLWDVSNPAQPRQAGSRLAISRSVTVDSLAFSPDGKVLAVGSDLGGVTLWNVSDVAQPRQVGPALALASSDGVGSVAFSPDGDSLAAGYNNTVTLWNVSDVAQPRQLGPALALSSDDIVLSTAFSSDGDSLAAGTDQGTVALWDVSNPFRPGQVSEIPAGHGGPVNSVAFSPTSDTLAAGGVLGTVTLWDASSQGQPHQLGQILTTGSSVDTVAFSRNGDTLTTGDDDGAVTQWDVSDPTLPYQLGQPLTAGDGNNVNSVAFSPDGYTLADSGGEDGDTVTLWSLPRTTVSPASKVPVTVVDATAFSPNGQILATGSDDDGVTLWNVSKPAQPSQLGPSLVTGNGDTADSVAFSPDGKTLAASDADVAVTLWNVSNPDRPRQLGRPLTIANDDIADSVAFSPNDKSLAVVGASGTVMLWNVSNPEQPRLLGRAFTVGSGDGVVYSVAFSRDSDTLAVSDNNTVLLFNVSNPGRPRSLGRPLTAGGDSGGSVYSVVFSPDGDTLAAGNNNTVVLWDVRDPSRPRQLSQPLTTASGRSVLSVAFSADGKTLAAANNNNTVTLWDVSDRARPSQLSEPITTGSSLSALAFSPQGDTLVTGESEALIQLWNLGADADSAASRICQLASGALTRQQWNLYISQLPYKPPCG
ncbi:MAG TPA: NACHT and WD repeat domain-containing protein [Trebonia sp.]|nr:NACHT and WD repeat domain-containing protein [Trebonia sp.]